MAAPPRPPTTSTTRTTTSDSASPSSPASFEISMLADRPELAAGLIPGLLDHWRHVAPEQTWQSRAEKFRAHQNRDTLPIGWVAHTGDDVHGTAALRAHDLDGREDLAPWLGGVYVLPAFRRRGIASALCRVVETKAREMGVARLYLFTPDQQALYARLGWRVLEPVVWRGLPSDIMIKDLRDDAGVPPSTDATDGYPIAHHPSVNPAGD